MNTFFYLLPLILIWGIRHGFDWDHILAITDLTARTDSRRRAVTLGSLYAVGHALVIVLLGSLAVLVGVTVPDWLDQIMHRVVGITLIILGCFLIVSIIKDKRNAMPQSSRLIALTLISRFFHWIHKKFHHHHVDHHHPNEIQYTTRTAFSVGMIHGIGAETPTQLLLFTTASGAAQNIAGFLLVLTFVVGLMISNTIITMVTSFGFIGAARHQKLMRSIGVLMALMSIATGILFSFNTPGVLPPIFGG